MRMKWKVVTAVAAVAVMATMGSMAAGVIPVGRVVAPEETPDPWGADLKVVSTAVIAEGSVGADPRRGAAAASEAGTVGWTLEQAEVRAAGVPGTCFKLTTEIVIGDMCMADAPTDVPRSMNLTAKDVRDMDAPAFELSVAFVPLDHPALAQAGRGTDPDAPVTIDDHEFTPIGNLAIEGTEVVLAAWTAGPDAVIDGEMVAPR